ncbi:Hypothetical predicted protein [Lecanosticta acicola]|uniref:F-box domain-containing protein n=1 Tax=Lecanosticta acicola TaxID=111012 RepID=A0AAI8YRQ7_9PEZI|nr:Hypothetical predicted protein [Lecanosticta acicola]
MDSSPLSKIPNEMLNRIFELVVTDDYKDQKVNIANPPDLAETCKAIRSVVLPMFFGNNDLVIYVNHIGRVVDSAKWIRKMVTQCVRIGMPLSSLISNITIDLGIADDSRPAPYPVDWYMLRTLYQYLNIDCTITVKARLANPEPGASEAFLDIILDPYDKGGTLAGIRQVYNEVNMRPHDPLDMAEFDGGILCLWRLALAMP